MKVQREGIDGISFSSSSNQESNKSANQAKIIFGSLKTIFVSEGKFLSISNYLQDSKISLSSFQNSKKNSTSFQNFSKTSIIYQSLKKISTSYRNVRKILNFY